MENKFVELTNKYLKESDADAVAVSVLDFNQEKIDWFEASKEGVNRDKSEIYFDLASLTKPLTNSFIALRHKLTDDPKLSLLLNHRAGLPAWGLLSKSSWKEQILSYKIKESETLYSDFSALRLMLEAEKKLKSSYYQLTKEYLDKEVLFWKDITNQRTVQNGFIQGKPNFKAVHDPNAFNLNVFTSHAGLFGTIEGVSRTLMNQVGELDLLSVMQNHKESSRFVHGFDRVQDPNKTLAGLGCSTSTFGHLGFTGTSFWIDPKKAKGVVILTNTTKYFWHHRAQLSPFRKEIGALVWK